MNSLTARKCLECGHYTITRLDGERCANCGGVTITVGHAIISDRNRNLVAEIKIKDIENVREMINVFSSLVNDKYVPEWIKKKIQSLVLNKLEKD